MFEARSWARVTVVRLGLAAIAATLLAAQAQAQVGATSRDPVADTQAEIAERCAPVGIPVDNVSYGDFNGDGRRDVVILIDVQCRTGASYCVGDRGCSHRIWVGEEGGRFRLTNDILANEARTAQWRGGPAIQFDNGAIWAWDGAAFALVSGGSGGAEEETEQEIEEQRTPPTETRRDTIREPRAEGRTAPEVEELLERRRGGVLEEGGAREGVLEERLYGGERTPPPLGTLGGVWRFDALDPIRGPARALVTNRDGARLVLACRGDFSVTALRFFPSEVGLDAIAVGPGVQVLIDFEIDGRVADTILVRQRGFDGPYIDRGFDLSGLLARRLRSGGRLIMREAGTGELIDAFSLRGSSDAIASLQEFCLF